MRWLTLFATIACTAPPAAVGPPSDAALDAVVEATPARSALESYVPARANLEVARRRLAARLRERPEARTAILAEAREVALTALTDALIPAWHGTPWAFYGTSEVPGEGEIACGYYVSTLLEHAGFHVERVPLAQQPSEHIVRTFTPRSRIRRFSDRPAEDVIAEVERQGTGLYVLGLDYHAALLWNDGERVRMCHSSVLGPRAALCEEAVTSPAMVSRYRVIGKLLDDAMVERWLDGGRFATVR